MKILGIIPARGGSKGIPRKNMRVLAGKPLLSWTAEAALESKLDRIILSSEDEEILNFARGKGVEVPFVRPRELAGDDTPSLDVVMHAVEELRRTEGYLADAVMLLQPTSPLRTSKHINEAIELFSKKPEATSLVSVVKAPHNMIPESLMRLEGDGYLNHVRSWGEGLSQRQKKPIYFARNGAAIYLVRTSYLLEKKSLYGPRILPYEMPRHESVDIDDLLDFEICEYLLSKRKSSTH
jgi:CMP-N-acetylneuraminic acid synthetase